MSNLIKLFLLISISLIVGCSTQNEKHVFDEEKIFNAEELDKINKYSEKFRKNTGTDIYIYTFHQLNTKEYFDEYIKNSLKKKSDRIDLKKKYIIIAISKKYRKFSLISKNDFLNTLPNNDLNGTYQKIKPDLKKYKFYTATISFIKSIESILK